MRSENINLILSEAFIVREGLKSLLQAEKNIKIIGEATDGATIIKLLESGVRADMILTDVNLPDMDCLKLAEILNVSFPHVKIVVLTSVADDAYVTKALQAGIKGYLLKSVGTDELIFAIQHISGHENYVCTELTVNFIRRLSLSPDTSMIKSAIELNFSQREIEILTLISQGFTNFQISEKLFASKRTIENYRQALIDKTGSRNIIALVRFALLNGLIS